MIIEIPELFLPLLTEDKRYKVFYGGRGGAKSESIARALIVKSYEIDKVILCAREVQKSIDESVYKLLKDVIQGYNLSTDFNILKNKIINRITGCEIIFHGLRDLSVDSLKSIKGIVICWVEEAHAVTTNSWTVLKPTVREIGSEIWVSFNRKHRKDPVWREFCEQPDDDVLVVKVNWYDNPFFPDVLFKEKQRDYRTKDKEEADSIWEGNPNVKSSLRVYSSFDIVKNTSVKEVPYYPGRETWTMWDFGISDPTAIAIVQVLNDPSNAMGVRINFVDEYISRNHSADHYKQWVLGHTYFDRNWRHAGDPSGANRDSSLKSWVSQLRPEVDMEYTHGKSIADYVALSNNYVPCVYINETQCPQFYDMFTNWEYPPGEDGKPREGSKPKHDYYSHPGTAFYYFIMERFNPNTQDMGYEIR